MLYDLYTCFSSYTKVAQYADDIAIWINVSLKKRTNLRHINYIQKLFQNELDKLSSYMHLNGFQFSVEKTHLVLFNNGYNPSNLPTFFLGGREIFYKLEVKFLGVLLTPKLNWKKHIDSVATKAVKSLNFLKIVSHSP